MAKQFTFEVMRGVHSEGLDEKKQPRIFDVGDKFETDNDLRKYNLPGMPEKFRLLSDTKAEKAATEKTKQEPEEAKVQEAKQEPQEAKSKPKSRKATA